MFAHRTSITCLSTLRQLNIYLNICNVIPPYIISKLLLRIAFLLHNSRKFYRQRDINHIVILDQKQNESYSKINMWHLSIFQCMLFKHLTCIFEDTLTDFIVPHFFSKLRLMHASNRDRWNYEHKPLIFQFFTKLI